MTEIAEFFAEPAGPAALPELLTLPLRERIPLLRHDARAREQFHDDQREWSELADTRYRACADLRPERAEPGAIRLGVKDTVDVAGYPTRLGLRTYRHHPGRTADVLRGLRGAAVTAKVVTTELNIGVGSGCVNPCVPAIGPAGSSTGSGVSVAAAICDLSLGTDVLGSVRWPAGRCGVVGLRVTHRPGRLGGVFPLSPAMDAPGWVARTADDLAYAWNELSLGPPVVTAGAARCRIGVLGEALSGLLEAPMATVLAETREAATAAGHEVTDVAGGELWQWRAPAWELCARDSWEGYQRWRHIVGDQLQESTRRAIEGGAEVSTVRAGEIRRAMARHRAGIGRIFAEQGVDAWLLPLDPTAPRALAAITMPASTIPSPGDPEYDLEIGFTPLASFAGLPAITFPMGRLAEPDAPLAVQLLGPPGSEATLIRLARDLSAARALPFFPPR